MRKLLMSSIVLFLFSSSILMLQVACDEDAVASPVTPAGQQKIVFTTHNHDGDYNFPKIWTANIDGTNIQEIITTDDIGGVTAIEYISSIAVYTEE